MYPWQDYQIFKNKIDLTTSYPYSILIYSSSP